MARGHDDYQEFNYFANRAVNNIEVPSVFDVGFSRTDGGGRIVFFEDMRTGGRRFDTSNGMGGAAPYIGDSGAMFYGFYKPVVLDPLVVNGYSNMSAYYAASPTGAAGMEVGFYNPSNPCNLFIEIDPYTLNGQLGRYVLMLEGETGKLSINTDSGWIEIFEPVNHLSYWNRLNTIKLVADCINHKYVRILYNGYEIPLTQDALGLSTSIQGGGAFMLVSIKGADASYLEPYYIHYVIMTIDEP